MLLNEESSSILLLLLMEVDFGVTYGTVAATMVLDGRVVEKEVEEEAETTMGLGGWFSDAADMSFTASEKEGIIPPFAVRSLAGGVGGCNGSTCRDREGGGGGGGA
jgi:hypothetical protein